MNRDDAVKKAEECFQFNVPGQEWFFTPLRLVAALENLGVLKFEEPKSAIDKAMDAIASIQFVDRYPGAIINALTAAGLKVVEK